MEIYCTTDCVTVDLPPRETMLKARKQRNREDMKSVWAYTEAPSVTYPETHGIYRYQCGSAKI